MDAAWTPRGNIVYIYGTYSVMVVSVSGEVIYSMPMVNPSDISVSNDDSIYISDFGIGVHQSMDDDASWSLLFNSADE